MPMYHFAWYHVCVLPKIRDVLFANFIIQLIETTNPLLTLSDSDSVGNSSYRVSCLHALVSTLGASISLSISSLWTSILDPVSLNNRP